MRPVFTKCFPAILLASAAAILTPLALPFTSPAAHAQQQQDQFSLCWSIYVGWMPWEYGDSSGIIDKWADKYGIEIDVVQINDYVESTPPAAGMVSASMLVIEHASN